MNRKWMPASVAVMVGLAIGLRAHEITPQRTKQLKAIFPGAAKFSESHAKLGSAQIAAIEKAIRGKVLSKHKNLSIYNADADGKTLGYAAFFDAKEPDGDIAQAGVGIGTDGLISKVIIFTHHQDENPLAQEGFLNQFVGKDVMDKEAWHPDHTVKLVSGKEQDSLNVMKAIRVTAAIVVESKSLRSIEGKKGK